MVSWIALHPQWFMRELELLERHYPRFIVDERRLDTGVLLLWGTLTVRPPGGAHSYPVAVFYPEGTPFEHPWVIPLEAMPELDGAELPKIAPQFYDRRHQMPSGNLCLFQRETRSPAGGDAIPIVQILRRAEQWLLGLHTDHWPPDTAETELEAHFRHGSDVLVAERFFGNEATGHGRFYLVPDMRRLVDRSPDFGDGCPMIISAMTEETSIIKTLDAREELADIYPWIDDDLWNPTALAAAENLNVGRLRTAEQGYWWALPAEPQPFHNGAGLLAALQQVAPNANAWNMVSTALGGELSVADRHYFGLRYPSRSGGIEWLFLVVPHKQMRQGGAPLLRPNMEDEFRKLSVLCMRAHSIRKEELWRRNETVIAPSISDKSVGLIGLGALGARVAELLAQAGVGSFRLCDSDYLKPVNVARHIGSITDFGAAKVRVAASRIRSINPRANLETDDLKPRSADGDLDRLIKFVSSVDIVISTAADENVESVVNDIAVTVGTPVLYGRALRRSSVGRVFLVRPGTDACKACLATIAEAKRTGSPAPEDWIEVSESSDEVLSHECGRPVIAGSAADLSFIASLTARTAIDHLEDNVGEKNQWIWSRSSAPEIDTRLKSALTIFSGTLAPIPECPTCRVPPVSNVVMNDEVRAFIVSETENSPKAETGGILIGFIDDQHRAVITRATGPGPNAIKSAARFHRDVEYVQSEIDRASRELNDQGLYVGEWHSHLEAAPSPSPTDVRSLSGIAASPRYLTQNPVMVIAGLDVASGRVRNIKSWVFVPAGRFYEIANNGDPSRSGSNA